MPKVSVIMGIYNCASTLQEALDSLYSQTFPDFEIILCDDGSKDNTYKLALENQRIHSNIVLLRNDVNLGLNATLNKCLAVAQGEYIARMDGDDISLPTRFEKQVIFLDEHPEYAVVSSPMIYFDEYGDYMEGRAKEYPDKYSFIKGTPFCHAPSMIRTYVMKEIGGYTEDKRMLRMEDYHLWFKLYAAGYRGANFQQVLYKMRNDKNAYKRRTFRSRLNELYVKSIGYRMLNLPFYYQIFALRPILVWMLPMKVYMFLHRNSRKNIRSR